MMIKITFVFFQFFIFNNFILATDIDENFQQLPASGHGESVGNPAEAVDAGVAQTIPPHTLVAVPFGGDKDETGGVFGEGVVTGQSSHEANQSEKDKSITPLPFRIIKNGSSVLSTAGVLATGILNLVQLPWNSVSEELLLKCIFGTMTMGGTCLFDASMNLTFGYSLIAGVLDCLSVKNAFGKFFTVGSMFMFISAGLGLIEATSLPTPILIQTIGWTVGSLLVLDSCASMVDWFNSRWFLNKLPCCNKPREEDTNKVSKPAGEKTCLDLLVKISSSPWAEFTPGSTAIFIMNALGWGCYNDETTSLQFSALIVSTAGGFLFALMSMLNWFECVYYS